MPKSTRFALALVIGSLISGAFVFLMLRGLDLGEVFVSLAHARPLGIVLAIVAYLASFVFRNLRWSIILGGRPTQGFWELFRILIVGWGVNNILPLRLGEVARASLLNMRRQLPFSYCLSTILVERLLDGFTLLLLGVAVLLLVPEMSSLAQVGTIALIIVLGVLAVAYSALRWRTFISAIPLPKRIAAVVQGIVSGLEILLNARGLLKVILFSIPVWLAEGLSFGLVAWSLNLDIPYLYILASLVMANLGILIPSAPGYVGTFDYFATLPLLNLDMPGESLVSFVVLVHAIQYFTTTGITAIVLSRDGLHPRRLFKLFLQRKGTVKGTV